MLTRTVYLDPDGTLGDWIGLLILAPAGVQYTHQCAGIAVEHRSAEGYLIPLGRASYDPDDQPVRVGDLQAIFHLDGACQCLWTGLNLPAGRRAALARLVSRLAYWPDGDAGQRSRLTLDPARQDQLAEAWIPVQTPACLALLLYNNCD